MKSIPHIAAKVAYLILFVLLILLVLPACSGNQQIDSVAEIDSATIESLTTATVATEAPPATPSPTVTATITPSPTLTPSPTPFPAPSDREYKMHTCKGVGGVQGFVSFTDSEDGVIDRLEEAVEPAFYEFYGESNDLLHNVWSHFYQQLGDAPTNEEGDFLPYGVFGDTNYEVCLKTGASDVELAGVNLIIPQVQSQETIDAACKNPNENGFMGQSQTYPRYVLEETLASDFLAEVALSDCYGFIIGPQTAEENAIAHLINQDAMAVFNLNPADAIPEEAVLKGKYEIYLKENDRYREAIPFQFMVSPGGEAFLVECTDNNPDKGFGTNYPELCTISGFPSNAPHIGDDSISSVDNPPNIDFGCFPDTQGLQCRYPYNAINVFKGVVTRVTSDQVKVTYEASDGTFEIYYGHIVPMVDVGDVLEVGDVIGETFPRDLGRHYLSVAMTGNEGGSPTYYDVMDPRFGLHAVAKLPFGKTWNP